MTLTWSSKPTMRNETQEAGSPPAAKGGEDKKFKRPLLPETVRSRGLKTAAEDLRASLGRGLCRSSQFSGRAADSAFALFFTFQRRRLFLAAHHVIRSHNDRFERLTWRDR